MRHFVFITLCGWLVRIQNSKYQVSHRYSYFSWWWAHSRLKHAEKRSKHTKKNLHQVGFIYKTKLLSFPCRTRHAPSGTGTVTLLSWWIQAQTFWNLCRNHPQAWGTQVQIFWSLCQSHRQASGCVFNWLTLLAKLYLGWIRRSEILRCFSWACSSHATWYTCRSLMKNSNNSVSPQN